MSCDISYQIPKYRVISCGSKKKISLRGDTDAVSKFTANVHRVKGCSKPLPPVPGLTLTLTPRVYDSIAGAGV